MNAYQCAWCPWDCPSPSVAACRTNAQQDAPAHPAEPPSVLAGVCEPAWTRVRTVLRRRSTDDVIRDISDYEEADGPDNNAP